MSLVRDEIWQLKTLLYYYLFYISSSSSIIPPCWFYIPKLSIVQNLIVASSPATEDLHVMNHILNSRSVTRSISIKFSNSSFPVCAWVCYRTLVHEVCPNYEVVEYQPCTVTPPESRLCRLLLRIYFCPTPPSIISI